jgi:hypothetical protein
MFVPEELALAPTTCPAALMATAVLETDPVGSMLVIDLFRIRGAVGNDKSLTAVSSFAGRRAINKAQR